MKQNVKSLLLTLSKAKGFTIIELLVVIGIISVLAVALLVTLNPAEAQKRARDSKRLKDANTIQAVVEQFLNDGGTFASCAGGSPCTSAAAGTADTQTCASTNWMTVSVCDYAKTVPLDPSNSSTRSCVDDSATGDIATACGMNYRFAITGTDYEINVRQESRSNLSKVTGDGGDSDTWVEVFTGDGTLIPASAD